MIKRKVSNNIYEIYIGYPSTVEVPIYRGDFFSFTLIGFNEVDDSPFDFSVYDSFKAQIRLSDPRNPNIYIELDNDSFILGKTDPSQDEDDEIHLLSEVAMDFDKPYRIAWLDIEATLNGEIQTLQKLKLVIESDVTRDE